jgi:oligoribonuclease (3'-5' exoribonuclease)
VSVVFVDTETTGLDPEHHEVWDIALIEEDGTEHEWHLRPHSLHDADETALRLTRFYERVEEAGVREETIEEGYPKRARTVQRPRFWTRASAHQIAGEIATLTAGQHIVGAVPSFDARFLAKLLRSEGLAPAWHYHLIDVETLIAGRLGLRPPLNSEDLSRAIGVEPQLFDRHTALGDARWVRAQYEAVYDPGAKALP